MRLTYVLCLISCLALVACGSSNGNAARGAALFSGQTPMSGDAPTCASCHLVEPGSSALVGPSLANIGNLAADRVDGQPAEAYLRTSLVNPDAYIVEGFQDGIMYKGYGHGLTPQQLDDLVAYLLTLKSG